MKYLGRIRDSWSIGGAASLSEENCFAALGYGTGCNMARNTLLQIPTVRVHLSPVHHKVLRFFHATPGRGISVTTVIFVLGNEI